jgi:hypothetical protein
MISKLAVVEPARVGDGSADDRPAPPAAATQGAAG